MFEMEFNSIFIKNIISNIISRIVSKKINKKIKADIEDLKIFSVGDFINIDLKINVAIDKEDLMKLIGEYL